MEHALSCSRGGFPTLWHNEIRDLIASLLSEVCPNVSVEPTLQELSRESLSGGSANRDSGARVEVIADGFWGPERERAYADVQVFNPFAPSNRQASFSPTCKMHEKEKKR